MADSEIRIGITADTTDAQAGLARFNAIANSSKEAALALGAALDKATASGLKGNEAIAAAVGSYERLTGASALLAATQERVATATGHVTTNFYAAQGAARLLEGQLPIRAFERFISTSSLVSGALQAAFPVIGAIALGEIVFRVGEAMFKAFDVGGARARQTAEEIHGVDQSFRTLLDSTNVEIDKLEEADAKIQHRVNPNGLKMAMDEAIEEADKLNSKLDGLIEKQEKAIKGMAGSIPQQLLGEKSGTKYEQTMLSEHQRHLDEQVSIQGQLNESQSYYNSLLIRMNELKERTGPEYSTTANQNARNEIAAVQQLIDWQQKEQQTIKATIDLGKEQKTHEGVQQNAEAARDNAEAQREADEFVRQEEEELARDREDHQKAFQRNAQETIDYIKREGEESQRVTDVITEAWEKNLAAQVQVTQETGRSALVQVEAAGKVAEAKIHYEEATGAITKVAAQQASAAVTAKEYSDRLAVLNAELQQLQGLADAGAQVGKQMQQVQQQIAQTTASGQAAGLNNQAQIAQSISQPFITGFNQINDAWLQMQNKLIFGTRNIRVAFANMGVGILEDAAAWLEKWLVAQLAAYIRDQIAHAVSEQTKLGQFLTALAIHKSAASTANVAAVTGNAAVAAAGTFAWWAPIAAPIAPAMAAAAFAETEAYTGAAAFEMGGIVPNTGMALVHGGEGVLPRNLTNMLMTVANSNTASSSSTTINSRAEYQGITDRNFREMARRHSDAIADAVGREARGGRRF